MSDALEQLWRETPRPDRAQGRVRLLCVRIAAGVHQCPERVRVTPELGVEGDRWSLKPDRHPEEQVTLMEWRVAELLAGATVPIHAAGDNVLVDLDLSEDALPVGTQLQLGTAIVEVTAKPHNGCGKFRDRYGDAALGWVNDRAHRERRLRGVNCRVVSPGEIAVGDAISRRGPD